MLTYLARRWLALLPTLLLASVLIFAIIQLSPGDPVRMKLGTEATAEEVANERERLGLDRPVPFRYAVWVGDVARLNLGRSLVNSRPVATLIAEAFPNTLRLSLTAFCLAVLVGLPLGCLAAVHQNRGPDVLITSLNALGLAVPAFWLGMLLILLFSVTLQWLPPSGVGNPGQPWYLSLHYLVLPVATIAVSNLSVFARFVRSAMIDVLGADYVRTARAKGLREPAVVARHALRNALIPVVTVLGIQFARLLGGAVVTETVFAYPGLGRLVVQSILNRDYPVVQGALMLVVAIFLVTSILVDLSYAWLDPRVSPHASG
ncbi:MAG TPA: ABC transporter permease [Chloroflexota bacterium]|jgi:ABC-type dipeptide/oligopeptide/nickel transport system permease component|nr:ABC transporter permease [Chloroflexota bacterium]